MPNLSLLIARSFNGRTLASDAGNWGSNPWRAANLYETPILRLERPGIRLEGEAAKRLHLRLP